MIKKNNLGYDSNLMILQNKKMFNYSVDTIMLGNFCSINSSTKKILEIGTNNGALAIFVAARKTNLKIDAIEIQKKALKLAKENLELNKMSSQIKLIHADFNEFWKTQNKNQTKKYDGIICNPPFYKVDASKMKKADQELLIATHEINLTLEQLVYGASKIIKQKGYLALVHKTERLVDIVCLMRQNGFEPKRIQFIHPREDQKSHLVLVEGRFKVGWGTFFLDNLYLHVKNKKLHVYRESIKKLYKPIVFKEKEI